MWLTFETQECILNARDAGDLIHDAAWGIEEVILNPLAKTGHGHRFHFGAHRTANGSHRCNFDSSTAGNAGTYRDMG